MRETASHRHRHFNDTALIRNDGARFELQLFRQPHDDDGVVDTGDLADKSAGYSDLRPGVAIDNQECGPGGFAEKPLVVLYIQDWRVKGKRARGELLERRRNGWRGH